ncbi:hypothetical protein NB701_004239 [Pantoea ananatis]|nr:RHS repeat-associated core domain-containing protein [uncultured Chryseobacterium sp.]MCW0350877.1 hypothetical protein [Pantoea ananatis]
MARTQGTREQTRQYDSLGRRTRQRSFRPDLPEQTIFERAFNYTVRGELSDVSDTLRGNTIYGYDEEGRLLRHYEARPDHSNRTFRYDDADNLLTDNDHPALPLTENRLTHWQNLFMKYDWWGNLISRRSGLYEQHYEYDAENRLIRAGGNGPEGRFTAHYHYDALGRRTRKTVTTPHGTRETRFLWQGLRLLQEQQQNGQCQTYVYDPNEIYSPLARIDHLRDENSGEVLWFTTDLNGAPLDIIDEQGQLRWSGHYGSFGEVTRQTEGFQRVMQQTAFTHQPLRYAGQYADSETGLHYNLFRYYDPQVGRFTVQDPIGLLGGWNLYQYAPNPLGWIDPWGLSGFDLSGRPLSSSQYSIWYKTSIPSELHDASRSAHFRNANEQLYTEIQKNPSLESKLPSEVVAHVQPGARGAFSTLSPPGQTWHHNAYDPTQIELIPRAQHRAPGAVQQTLHPSNQGGFKKLSSGSNCK